MNRVTLVILILLLLAGAGYYFISKDKAHTQEILKLQEEENKLPFGMAVSGSGTQTVTATATPEALLPADITTIIDPTKTVPLDTIPQSVTVLVNRAYLLPSDYEPDDLVVPDVKSDTRYVSDKRKLRQAPAKALEKMFADAKKKGLELIAVSGYRSYERQRQIYDRNVKEKGKSHADKYSAIPGSSEHQSGLAMDVANPKYKQTLDQGFADTKEGKYIEKNAHKYGFVIRYPKGKSKITGYSYEPWHIRYVGTSTAQYLYKNDLTLEEYYNVSMNKDESEQINDIDEPDKKEKKDKKSSNKKDKKTSSKKKRKI